MLGRNNIEAKVDKWCWGGGQGDFWVRTKKVKEGALCISREEF